MVDSGVDPALLSGGAGPVLHALASAKRASTDGSCSVTVTEIDLNGVESRRGGEMAVRPK